MTNLSHSVTRRRRSVSAELAVTSFKFIGGGTISNPTTWGEWLKNQPAPVAKRNHKLDLLTTYLNGQVQEHDISLDLCERWGYALNIGYGNNFENVVADAKLTTPVTISGRLLKLAINNPVKYPIAGAIKQTGFYDGSYPQEQRLLKEGYLRNAEGNVIGDWSPEATPAAMLISAEFKCAPLVALVKLGVNITNIYDGGEGGLHIPGENAAAKWGGDPRVVAARGTEDWVDYISRKKGEQHRLYYNMVKQICPNRSKFIYYAFGANPYANIPGARYSGWNYDQTWQAQDVPTGSVYFRDTAIIAAGMGNPTITDRAYVDQLSHHLAAVSEQITNHNQRLTYPFVSAGNGNANPATNQYHFMPIPSYKGFLKCMYAAGQTGAVAGYFAAGTNPTDANYPAFNTNTPPHWILQEMALGEVHARFTWLDDYILDGDLLPGLGGGRIKGWCPGFEFTPKTRLGDFFISASSGRVIVRKRKLLDSWLVVLWNPEEGTSLTPVTTAPDRLVWVDDIPGLPPIQFVAGGEGSIYTVVKSNGSLVITKMD